MGPWLILSFNLAAVPDACAHAENSFPRELYIYGPHTTSWLFIRDFLVQSNRILCPTQPHLYFPD